MFIGEAQLASLHWECERNQLSRINQPWPSRPIVNMIILTMVGYNLVEFAGVLSSDMTMLAGGCTWVDVSAPLQMWKKLMFCKFKPLNTLYAFMPKNVVLICLHMKESKMYWNTHLLCVRIEVYPGEHFVQVVGNCLDINVRITTEQRNCFWQERKIYRVFFKHFQNFVLFQSRHLDTTNSRTLPKRNLSPDWGETVRTDSPQPQQTDDTDLRRSSANQHDNDRPFSTWTNVFESVPYLPSNSLDCVSRKLLGRYETASHTLFLTEATDVATFPGQEPASRSHHGMQPVTQGFSRGAAKPWKRRMSFRISVLSTWFPCLWARGRKSHHVSVVLRAPRVGGHM